MAVLSAAKSLCGAWKAIGCAQKMKLSWVLKNREAYLGPDAVRETMTVRRGSSCDVCDHKGSLLSGGLTDCAICAATVCSRCRLTVQLSKADARLEITSSKHDICKNCFLRVANDDAMRMAREMYTGAPIVEWRLSASQPRHHDSDSSGQRRFGGWRDTMSTLSSGHIWSDLMDIKQSSDELRHDDEDLELDEYEEGSQSVVVEPVILGDFEAESIASRPSEAVEATKMRSISREDERYWEMYSQIESLQLTADETLDLAKQVTSRMTKP